MNRISGILILCVVALGCSGDPVDPPPQNQANGGSGDENRFASVAGEHASDVSTAEVDASSASSATRRNRAGKEDEIHSRIGQAILDALDEADGGSDEERDAVVDTLKANDHLLRQATGKRAQRLILENNNHRRFPFVAPPE